MGTGPWRVLATYLAAVAGIFAVSGAAVVLLASAYPDTPATELLQGLPGLVAGALASSTGLGLTLLVAVRPLDAGHLRLRPGWETGSALTVMTLGTLALGQTLDSAAMLSGLGDVGAMAMIRRALGGTLGPGLFVAVMVIGVVAPVAEEVFFRGYMQSRLRECWSPARAVVVTSAGFAILHADVWAVHTVMALALGLYLGFVTELTGSALPAIVCHVVNNVVFTLQTALGATLVDPTGNAAAAALGTVLFLACVAWLRRVAPPPAG